MTTISKDFIVKNGIVVGDNADVAGSVTAASFSGDGSALTGTATSFTANNVTTNANLTGVITSSGNATSIASQTGTGSKFVVDDSPTLITPNLGTPSTLVGTNITGTASGLTSGTVTTNANLTGGVTSVGNAATVVTNANLTGVITSSGNATAIASQTGTGTKFVVDTSPTLITPDLGTPSALVGTNISGTAAGLTAGTVTDGVYTTGSYSNPAWITTLANNKITGLGSAALLNSGVANGVATLDGGGTVPTAQLPAAVLGALKYQGTWNANTNTPALASSVGTQGYYYVVATAGTTTLDGISSWEIGDWAIFGTATWQKIDNTDAVTSVNGFTGTVSIAYADLAGAIPTWNQNTTGNAATVTTNANLTGDVTSVGNATTLTNAPVIAKVLTGYVSGAGTVAATDSILQAIQKLDGNDATNANLTGMVTSIGNATTVVTNANLTGGVTSVGNAATVVTNANLTGSVTSIGNAATVVTNANLTGVITSSGNATSIASQTGTGSKFVVDDSPTLITPNLGTPSTLVGTNITGTAAGLTAGSAASLSTTLAVASGGTGLTTLTDKNVILGAGTSTPTFVAPSTTGNVLTSNGTTWVSSTPAGGGATLSNDTTTATPLYPMFADAITGTPSTVYTSNSNYLYTPSTGALQAKEVVASNALFVNNMTVNNSYTIPAGNSASSIGAITIASGAVVTIPSGSRWVIL